jgi:hypothetical protein
MIATTILGPSLVHPARGPKTRMTSGTALLSDSPRKTVESRPHLAALIRK